MTVCAGYIYICWIYIYICDENIFANCYLVHTYGTAYGLCFMATWSIGSPLDSSRNSLKGAITRRTHWVCTFGRNGFEDFKESSAARWPDASSVQTRENAIVCKNLCKRFSGRVPPICAGRSVVFVIVVSSVRSRCIIQGIFRMTSSDCWREFFRD